MLLLVARPNAPHALAQWTDGQDPVLLLVVTCQRRVAGVFLVAQQQVLVGKQLGLDFHRAIGVELIDELAGHHDFFGALVQLVDGQVFQLVVHGGEPEVIQTIGEQIEQVLGDVAGTRNVLAERVVGGYFLDFEVRRAEAARYGLNVEDVLAVVETAVGGKNITQTIEGRERYPINVRYARELRDDIDGLRRILVATPTGAQVPIGQLADIRLTTGPPVIKSEDAQLVGYVFVDIVDRDIGSYVAEAQTVVAEGVELPSGYYLEWSGQYEYMQRAKERLIYVVPLTLMIIFLLLYLNFGSVAESLIVMLSVPFALVGAVWLLWYLEYNLSVAVWVGIIALAGVAAETGVVMIV